MSRWSKILMWFAVWTAVGLFFSTQLILLNANLYHRSIPVMSAILGTLPKWYVWLLLTPLILWMSRRFPLERNRYWLRALLHFAAAAVLGLIVVMVYAYFAYHGGFEAATMPTYTHVLLFFTSVDYHWSVLTYITVAAICQAVVHYRNLQEREARLAQAQLQALKSQLHPHFLFNSLHAAMALIRKDPPAAERMIVRLSELLRATLENSGATEVPLRQEIRFLEQYLDIERTRFADRLTVDWQIDPSTLEVPVPNLILQPLVENAVKHGIFPRSAPGRIEVRAARENGHLVLQVSDNGAGPSALPPKEGIGLSNTRARLRQLYGEHQKFELSAPDAGGFAVRMEIPLPMRS